MCHSPSLGLGLCKVSNSVLHSNTVTKCELDHIAVDMQGQRAHSFQTGNFAPIFSRHLCTIQSACVGNEAVGNRDIYGNGVTGASYWLMW